MVAPPPKSPTENPSRRRHSNRGQCRWDPQNHNTFRHQLRLRHSNTSLNILSLCLHWKPLGGWTKTSSWHVKLCSACCCCAILQSPGQGRASPIAPLCPLTWNLLSGALQGRQDGIIGSGLSAVECPCCLQRAGIGPSAGLLPLAFCSLAAAGCCWLPLVCPA